MRRSHSALAVLLPCALASVLFSGCSSSDSGGDVPGGGAASCDPQGAQDAVDALAQETSCILSCKTDCPDATQPWVCPVLADWATLPHDCDPSACGGFSGQTTDVPQAGKCTASAPGGDAVAKTAAAGSPVILPDGRRLVPAGKESVLVDADLKGTFPFSALRVPGTPFVVVSDDGYDDNAVRVVDTTKVGGAGDPVVSKAKFAQPASLNYGIALAPDGTLYVASGAPDSVVRAFSLDPQTGAIAELASKDVPVQNAAAGDVFPSGIDISPDGKTLVVAQVKGSDLLVYSLDPASYGQKLDAIPLGAQDHYAALFDPASAGTTVYVSAWQDAKIVEVDLSTKAVRAIPTGRQPEEIAFLDANYLAVADSLGDDIAIVDRAAGSVVANVPVDAQSSIHGSSPSALAYDPVAKRLYATLASRNAVAAFDVTPSTGAGVAPTFAPAGMIPTGWWPTDVVVAGPTDPAPGSLFVISGKGHGTGPTTTQLGFNQGVIGEEMHGSVQQIDPPTAASLATTSAAWKTANEVGALAGQSTVTCPEGAPYDFPVPATNTEGASKAIEHIVFIVRENKTFDGVMGDLPGVDGDPSLVIAPGKMEQVWGNIRSIAQTFAHADNFYEDAEQSIQGHYWTAFGRMSDFTERTWLTVWGRGTRGSIPTQGVADSTRPDEGGIFDWLDKNKVAFDDMGELLDRSAGKFDTNYGSHGLVSTDGTNPDTNGACYIAARARVLCNLKPFTYVWLVNDHAFGGAPGKPNPGIMMSVNDEATGMIVDGISHSPLWKSSLVVVLEDDPQDGADHVDAHRSLVVLASPWVKRGYVSHTHFDVASVHKLFAHLLGLPYNNRAVADAPLPLDLFTSTPDYAPFDYKPRTWTDNACNAPGTKMAEEAVSRGWDFAEPDDQPGLSSQNWRWLHGER